MYSPDDLSHLCQGPWGKLNKALIVHLTAFKGFTSLPLSKVSMWQHGQQRSSACQLLNKNSSSSPTIRGLLEVCSTAMTERADGETVSFSLPLPPSAYICIPSSQSSYPQSVNLQSAQPGVLYYLVLSLSTILRYFCASSLLNKTAAVKLLVTFQF